jgi:hypothetical protein
MEGARPPARIPSPQGPETPSGPARLPGRWGAIPSGNAGGSEPPAPIDQGPRPWPGSHPPSSVGLCHTVPPPRCPRDEAYRIPLAENSLDAGLGTNRNHLVWRTATHADAAILMVEGQRLEGCGVVIDADEGRETVRMAMGTIADNIKPDHEQASTPRFPQPGVLVVPSGPASTHATGSNRQVAANPAQIRWTAAWRTANKPKSEQVPIASPSPLRRRRGQTPMAGSRQPPAPLTGRPGPSHWAGHRPR